MTQTEMAEFLSISPSAYARLEKNETTIPFEELNRISDSLNIPIQDLLPEIFTVHSSHNHNGLIFGGVVNNNYYDRDAYCKELEAKIKVLENENMALRKKLEGN